MCLIASVISVLLKWVERRSFSSDAREIWMEPGLLVGLEARESPWHRPKYTWICQRFPSGSTSRCHSSCIILNQQATTSTIRRAKKIFRGILHMLHMMIKSFVLVLFGIFWTVILNCCRLDSRECLYDWYLKWNFDLLHLLKHAE